MTKDQLMSIKFRRGIFAQLENGGHRQIATNDDYPIRIVHEKRDRNSEWRTYYTVADPNRGNPETYTTLDDLVEAVADMPWIEPEDRR